MGQAPSWWTEQLAGLARKTRFGQVADQLVGPSGNDLAFEIARVLAPADAFLIDCTVFNADPAFWPAIDKLARKMTSFTEDPGKPPKGQLNYWSTPALAVPWAGSWWTTDGRYIELDGKWFSDGHFGAEVLGRNSRVENGADIEQVWSNANRGGMWRDKIQPLQPVGSILTDGMTFYNPINLALTIRLLGYPVWVEDRMIEMNKPLLLRTSDGRRGLLMPMNVPKKPDGGAKKSNAPAQTWDEVDWVHAAEPVSLGRKKDDAIAEAQQKKAERAAATPKLGKPTGGRIELFDASAGLPGKAAGATLARMLLSAPLRAKVVHHVGAQVVGDVVYVSDGNFAVPVPIDSPFIPPIPPIDGVYGVDDYTGEWSKASAAPFDIHQFFEEHSTFLDPVVAVELLPAAEGGTRKDGVVLVSAEGRVSIVNPKLIWAAGLLLGGPPFGLRFPPGLLERIDPDDRKKKLPPSMDEQGRFYAGLSPIQIVGPSGSAGLIMPLDPGRF